MFKELKKEVLEKVPWINLWLTYFLVQILKQNSVDI